MLFLDSPLCTIRTTPPSFLQMREEMLSGVTGGREPRLKARPAIDGAGSPFSLSDCLSTVGPA